MEERARVLEDLAWAADFDPRDPRLGLDWEDLSSDRLTRRTMLRLVLASGALHYLVPLFAPAPAFAQGQPGGELKAAWAVREFTNLDPAYINQVVQFQVTSNVLGGLTHIDAGLIPRPDLAEGWEVSSDGLTWTFRLRRGVRWHNGDRFTADDVVFTFNRTRDPATQSLHRSILDPIERLEKLDDFTVRFHMKEPRASFLIKITERSSGRALTIVNRRAIQQLGREGHTRRPVGTGPFRIVEHRLGERLVLEKFPDYHVSGRPLVDRVTIFNIEEPATLVSAIESGQVEYINAVPEALRPRLAGNPQVTISSADDPGFQAIFFNLRRDKAQRIGRDRLPTDDQKVRLAMAKGMDRDDLIRRALFGRGVPAYGPIPRAQKQYFRDLGATSAQRFDPDEARRLLAEAGYPNGFKIKMLVTPLVRRRGEVIADIYKRTLRLDIELEVVDFPVQVQRLNQGQYELVQIGSGGDPDPDDSIDDWFWSGAKFNTFGYNNPQVDALNDAQRETADVTKRVRWVQAAVDLIAKDAPCVFLFHPMDELAYRKHVRGVLHIPGLRDLDTITVR
ncbi:MAG: ABC transporter substrate-binding protein [Armatimonadota bacterium]|nr:ABC transporter substrate-binding protein [Armatimonadota bacterium]MDR7486378.1 ABC transporter substrate-binding protein [Armatimonadota bacterium]MDR7532140.1 ABC transporter substrate-binding protein [Armatimonadota bacterium]MDR7536728.1 ABC transporter substrate-binding protein [Armatimonadota bacterium]